MTKYIVALCVLPILAACGSGGGNGGGAGGSGGGDGSGGTIGGLTAEAFYQQFQMKAKSDCAGLRRSFNYVEGWQRIGEAQVDLSLKIDENGTFEARVSEDYERVQSVDGVWRREGKILRFFGLGTAEGEVYANGRKALLRFKFEGKVLNADLTGQTIGLLLRHRENDSGMTECSPADHARMRKDASGIVTIDGMAAEAFWPSAFTLGSSEPRARSGERGDTDILLRVYPDGTFHYVERKNFETLAEVKGTWSYSEGLVILKNLGVLTPFSKEPNGYLYPYLYLSHDPATGAKVRGKLSGIALPGYSH